MGRNLDIMRQEKSKKGRRWRRFDRSKHLNENDCQYEGIQTCEVNENIYSNLTVIQYQLLS